MLGRSPPRLIVGILYTFFYMDSSISPSSRTDRLCLILDFNVESIVQLPMGTTNIKIVVSVVFFLATIICVSVPVCVYAWIRKRHRSNNPTTSSREKGGSYMSMKILVSYITCFGGGVFLGVCLLDLLPDVVHHINTTLKSEFNYDNEHGHDYPFGEMLVGLGFFIVLFVEQIILSHRAPVAAPTTSSNGKAPLVAAAEHEVMVVSTDQNEQFSSVVIKKNFETEQNLIAADAKQNTTAQIVPLTTMRNLLMILSLVIHSVFEGIVIGSSNDYQTIIQLAVAILVHKSVISFSVGLKLMSSSDNRLKYLACIIFASATPVGILMMLSMQELLPTNRTTKAINDVLRAFACGTFLYITFFDVLPHELNTPPNSKLSPSVQRQQRLIKTFCVFVGFSFTTILLFATK